MSTNPEPKHTSTTAAEEANNSSTAAFNPSLPAQPSTSQADAGTSKRPRDARLVHLILASLGVSAYQERVPLQLLDFAYRYTSSVLSDAAHIQAEGWDGGGGHEGGTTGKGRGGKAGTGAGTGTASSNPAATAAGALGATGSGEREEVSLASLRIAIGSRMQYQHQGTLPKEFLISLARERNRVGLAAGRTLGGHDPVAATNSSSSPLTPGAGPVGAAAATQTALTMNGVRLPPERYCLTGVGWGLKEEWESEGFEEDGHLNGDMDGDTNMVLVGHDGDAGGNGIVDGADAEQGEEGEATMEDIFGPEGPGDDQEQNQANLAASTAGGDVAKGEDGQDQRRHPDPDPGPGSDQTRDRTQREQPTPTDVGVGPSRNEDEDMQDG